MQRSKLNKIFSLLTIGLSVLLLTACKHEQMMHGVPESTWKNLTTEQKQLIVDQSFEESMK